MTYPIFQDVKIYLGIERSEDDFLIATFLNQAISITESYTGRKFVGGNAASKTFYTNDRAFINDKTFIFFDDISNVVSLTINGNLIDPTHYIVHKPVSEEPAVKITLKNICPYRFSNYAFEEDFSEVVVNGVWSYSTNCPQDVFGALVRLTSWLYHQKDNAADYDRPVIFSDKITLPSGIPNDVTMILNGYMRYF